MDWNNPTVPVSSTLTGFLLLSFLLVFVHSGPLHSFLVIGHVLPPSLPLILRVGELFVTGYPLICGADCNDTMNVLVWPQNNLLLNLEAETGEWSYWTGVCRGPPCPRPPCRRGRRPRGWPASARWEREAASAGSQTVAA